MQKLTAEIPYAIKIENVKKQYRLGQIGGGTLRGDVCKKGFFAYLQTDDSWTGMDIFKSFYYYCDLYHCFWKGIFSKTDKTDSNCAFSNG